ncbi:MAG: hypothetical protein AAF938_04175 [Myxococcota bacterium]
MLRPLLVVPTLFLAGSAAASMFHVRDVDAAAASADAQLLVEARATANRRFTALRDVRVLIDARPNPSALPSAFDAEHHRSATERAMSRYRSTGTRRSPLIRRLAGGVSRHALDPDRAYCVLLRESSGVFRSAVEDAFVPAPCPALERAFRRAHR